MGLFSLITTAGSVGTSVFKTVLSMGKTALKCGKKVLTSGIGKFGLLAGGLYLMNHNNAELKLGLSQGFTNLMDAIGNTTKGVIGRVANVADNVTQNASKMVEEETACIRDESKVPIDAEGHTLQDCVSVEDTTVASNTEKENVQTESAKAQEINEPAKDEVEAPTV